MLAGLTRGKFGLLQSLGAFVLELLDLSEFLAQVLQLSETFFAILVHVVEQPHVHVFLEVSFLFEKLVEAFGFCLLVFQVPTLDFESLLLPIGRECELLGGFLGLPSFFIVGLELHGATDFFDELYELCRCLVRQRLDVALKDEKVAGLHEDANLCECFFVGGEGDRTVVNAVGSGSIGGDGTTEAVFLVVVVFVDEHGRGREIVRTGPGRSKDEVLHLLTAEVSGLHTEYEGYGVHEVGLAGAVGAWKGGKTSVQQGVCIDERIVFAAFTHQSRS